MGEVVWLWMLRLGGYAGIAHETVRYEFERPWFLLLFAIAVGFADAIAAILRAWRSGGQ